MGHEHVLDPGRPYHVYVTYYQSPAKFWVQIASSVEQLDELHEQIAEYQKHSSKDPIIARGRLVWARYKDGGDDCFYRARVENQNVQGSGQCRVYFVDYGNTDVLSPSEIRELPSRFAALPGQAIECSLSAATSFTEDFNKLIDCETLYLSALSVTDEGLHLVELATSPAAFQALGSRRSGGDYSNGTQGSSFYAPLQFNLAGHIDVCISCVEDSGYFHCQLIEQAQNLKELMYDIQNMYNNESAYVTQPKPNLPCIVQDQNDGVYYRGKIMSIEGTSVMVKYVDFGSASVVSISCLRQILDEHILLPAQAIECSLNDVERLNVNSVVQLLQQYESSIPVVLKVLFKTAGHYEVELIDTNGNEDYSLIDLLKMGSASLPKQSQRFKTTSIKLLVPNPDVRINDEEKVFVSAILTDRCFFGQLLKYDVNTLEQMTDELSEMYARNPGQRVDPSIGGICCVKFAEDGRFYRGRIIDIKGPQARVFFIDYGNLEWKEFSELYELVVEHYSLPQQGIKCELKDTYSSRLNETILDELLIDNEVVVKLESRHSDVFTVSVPECADNDAIAPKINVYLQQRPQQIKGMPMVKSSVAASGDQAMEYRKPSVKASQAFDVVVAHVESPDLFFCQLKDSSNQLNELMDAIAEFCSRLQPSQGIVDNLVIGMPCLALYTDEVWYRASVTGIEASGAVEVHFVDYGNHERIQRSGLKTISNGFMHLPVQAVPCSMYGIGCRAGEMWTQDESDRFFELSSGESVRMQVMELARAQDRFIVQLFEGDLNLNQTFGKMTGKILRAQAAPPSAAGMAPRPIRGTGSTISVSAPPKTQGIDNGSFYKAYVVYVIGPDKFYCQMENQGETLESFMADLNTEYGQLAPNQRSLPQAVEGMACCTVYPEDKRWHRAVITTLKGTQADVRFIDYGNTETAVTSQLKELTGRFLLVPEFSFECSLNGVKSPAGASWSEDAGYQFEQLALDKLMVVCVKEQPKPGAFSVELVDSVTNQSVGDQLVSLGIATKEVVSRSPAGRGAGISRRPAQPGNPGASVTDPNSSIVPVSFAMNSEYDVVMGHINSPQQFWCQPAEHSDTLDAMMEKLQTDYDHLAPGDLKIHHPWVGQVVAGRFTADQRWYRAEIIEIERSSVKVKYVDYGNSEFLSSERVRVLKADYTVLPRQGVECCLEGISSVEPQWGEGAISMFEDVTFEKELVFRVTKAKGKVYHGSLVQKGTGKIVENIMVKQGLAKADDTAGGHAPPSQSFQPVGRPITKSQSPLPGSSASVSRASSSSAEEVPPFRRQKLTEGERFRCIISWVTHPLDFFCSRLDAEELLAAQMEALNQHYNGLSDGDQCLSNATVGQPCVARYSADENWYRASISDIRGNRAKVLFVDYGNTQKVEIPKLKYVSKEFRTLPEQAIRCCIEGIEKPAGGWSQQVCKLFQNICSQQVMCSVMSQDNKMTLVQIDDASNRSVGAQLVELGVTATPTGSLANAGSGTGKPGFGGQSRFGGGGQDDRGQRGFGGDRPQRGFGSGSNDSDRPQRGFGSGSNDGDRPQRGFGSGGSDRPKKGFGGTDDEPRQGRFGGDSNDRRGGRFGGDDREQRGGSRFGRNEDQRGERGGFGGGDQGSQGGRFGRQEQPRQGFGAGNGRFGGSGPSSAVGASGGDDWGDNSPAAAAAPTPSSVFQSSEPAKLSTITFKSLDQDQLLVGYKMKAEIVHAESTAEFWIQLTGHIDKLDAIMDQLEERYSQATGDLYSLKNPKVGAPCAAKYSEDNGWYRAKVLHVTPKKIHVFFVDYGNTDWVSPSNLKELKKEHVDLAMQAMRCALAGVQFSSPKATEKLNELTEKKTLIVEICDHLPSNGISVLLKDELGVNINDAVTESLSSTTFPPAQFERKTEIEAVVSHVNSPGSFYVQKADQLDDLAGMADAMLTVYDDPASYKLMETAAIGFPCIAKYSEDGAYYRAVISSLDSTKAVVTFIDYGNQDTIEISSLRVPSAEHLAMPAFATRCCMTGLPTWGWSDENKTTLETLVDVDSLTVLIEDETTPASAVITVNGESLNDKFKAPSVASTTKTVQSIPADVAPPVMTLDTIYPAAKPPLNCPLSVFVTQVNSAKSFYVQLESVGDAVANLADKIQTCYSSLGPSDLILENHTEGKPCVAKFSEDEAWYRAFIIRLLGSKVTVRFIDYGNSDTIDRTTLKSPTAEFASLPQYAIHCCVADASPEKNDDILAMLNAEEAAITMTFLSVGNPCQVQITRGEQVLNAELSGDAVTAPESVQTTTSAAPRINQAYQPPSVKVGEAVSVFSTHAESPTDFFLQAAELEEQLTALADKLVAEYGSLGESEKTLQNPEVGHSCVAKYDEDESWYRAEVKSLTGDTCEVLFVDYGNSATVPLAGLKVPSEELLKIPVMAVHCALHSVKEGSWTEELHTQFNELIMEAELTAEFLDDKQPPVPVKLVQEGKDLLDMFPQAENEEEKKEAVTAEESNAINEELSTTDTGAVTEASSDVKEEAKTAESQEAESRTEMAVGEKVEIIVTHVEHPSLFWIRAASAESQIEVLHETLKERYDDKITEQAEHSVKVGDDVVTKYDDDEWYRAKVMDVSEEKATVYFSDFGNTDEVSLNRCFPAPEDLLVLPSQVHQCELADVAPVDDLWSAEAIEAFQDLVLERKMLASVLKVVDVREGDSAEVFSVKLLNVGISIADKLVENRYALAVHEESVFSEYNEDTYSTDAAGVSVSKVQEEETEEVISQEAPVAESAKTEITEAGSPSDDQEQGPYKLPLNKEVEVVIGCVHIPDGLFDVYPSDKPESDDIAQCRLTTFLPDEDDWSTELQTYFADFIEKKVIVKAIDVEEGIYTVDMFDKEVSVAETLAKKGLFKSTVEDEDNFASCDEDADDNADAEETRKVEETSEAVTEVEGKGEEVSTSREAENIIENGETLGEITDTVESNGEGVGEIEIVTDENNLAQGKLADIVTDENENLQEKITDKFTDESCEVRDKVTAESNDEVDESSDECMSAIEFDPDENNQALDESPDCVTDENENVQDTVEMGSAQDQASDSVTDETDLAQDINDTEQVVDNSVTHELGTPESDDELAALSVEDELASGEFLSAESRSPVSEVDENEPLETKLTDTDESERDGSKIDEGEKEEIQVTDEGTIKDVDEMEDSNQVQNKVNDGEGTNEKSSEPCELSDAFEEVTDKGERDGISKTDEGEKHEIQVTDECSIEDVDELEDSNQARNKITDKTKLTDADESERGGISKIDEGEKEEIQVTDERTIEDVDELEDSYQAQNKITDEGSTYEESSELYEEVTEIEEGENEDVNERNNKKQAQDGITDKSSDDESMNEGETEPEKLGEVDQEVIDVTDQCKHENANDLNELKESDQDQNKVPDEDSTADSVNEGEEIEIEEGEVTRESSEDANDLVEHEKSCQLQEEIVHKDGADSKNEDTSKSDEQTDVDEEEERDEDGLGENNEAQDEVTDGNSTGENMNEDESEPDKLPKVYEDVLENLECSAESEQQEICENESEMVMGESDQAQIKSLDVYEDFCDKTSELGAETNEQVQDQVTDEASSESVSQELIDDEVDKCGHKGNQAVGKTTESYEGHGEAETEITDKVEDSEALQELTKENVQEQSEVVRAVLDGVEDCVELDALTDESDQVAHKISDTLEVRTEESNEKEIVRCESEQEQVEVTDTVEDYSQDIGELELLRDSEQGGIKVTDELTSALGYKVTDEVLASAVDDLSPEIAQVGNKVTEITSAPGDKVTDESVLSSPQCFVTETPSDEEVNVSETKDDSEVPNAESQEPVLSSELDQEGEYMLPMNEEVEVMIDCVQMPAGLFDVYPMEQPATDDIIQCRLDAVLPDASNWSSDLQNYFCDFIDKKVVVTAKDVQKGIYVVDMKDEGVSVVDTLYQKGYLKSEDELASQEDESSSAIFPVYRSDTTLSVRCVSGDGPAKFVCQLENGEQLTDLTRTLESTFSGGDDSMPVLSRENAVDGQLCVVKSSGSVWCRGVLVEVAESSCKVNLVDHGKVEEVSLKDVYDMPEQFKNTPARCITLKLYGVITEGDDTQESKVETELEGGGDNTDTQEEKDIDVAFKELCGAGPLVATIVSRTGSGPNTVYQALLNNADGENINSELVSKSHAWVAPVSSLSVDLANFDRLAEEQDNLETSFLEVSCMKDNSIGDIDGETDDSGLQEVEEESKEDGEAVNDVPKEAKEGSPSKVEAVGSDDQKSSKEEENQDENCNGAVKKKEDQSQQKSEESQNM